MGEEVGEPWPATVQLAAEAHGVAPGQIAKTLAFKVGEKPLLIVAMGSLVGFIAMAIILPIFKMSSLVSG